MLGALSALLDIPETAWLDAIHARLAAKLHRLNDEAFAIGRAAAVKRYLSSNS
jgi:indolepyruvate ferredoxin oxidoreductase beta subunit